MKLSIESNNLASALSAVNKTAPTRTSLPILKNVLLKSEGSKLSLSTTDLEISIKVEIIADVEKEGSTTVLTRTFFEYINSLPSSTISLELVNNNLEVKGIGNKAKFLTISPEEFPNIPKHEGDHLFKIGYRDFIGSIEKVAFSASVDEARQVITGILFELDENNLNIVGVDGYRLSRKILDLKSKEKMNLIIPSKALSEMMRIVGEKKEEEKEVKIYLFPDKNNVSFLYNDIELVTRLIEGEYPDYKRIIPNEFTTESSILTEDLINALKIVNVFTKASSSNRVCIKFEPNTSKITLSTSLSQVGENMSEIQADIKGEEGEVHFNIKYLNDILNHLKSQNILLSVSVGKTLPAVFKELKDKENEEDNTFLHMIMPMSIK